MEHAGIHRAPPPGTLALRRKLPGAAPGCSRGPGCPTSAGEPELSRGTGGQRGCAGHLLFLPAQWGGRTHWKSKSICKQEHASQAPGTPAPGPAAERRGRADSSGPQENHHRAAFQGDGDLEDGKINQQSVHSGFVWFSTNGIELAARTLPARL